MHKGVPFSITVDNNHDSPDPPVLIVLPLLMHLFPLTEYANLTFFIASSLPLHLSFGHFDNHVTKTWTMLIKTKIKQKPEGVATFDTHIDISI